MVSEAITALQIENQRIEIPVRVYNDALNAENLHRETNSLVRSSLINTVLNTQIDKYAGSIGQLAISLDEQFLDDDIDFPGRCVLAIPGRGTLIVSALRTKNLFNAFKNHIPKGIKHDNKNPYMLMFSDDAGFNFGLEISQDELSLVNFLIQNEKIEIDIEQAAKMNRVSEDHPAIQAALFVCEELIDRLEEAGLPYLQREVVQSEQKASKLRIPLITADRRYLTHVLPTAINISTENELSRIKKEKIRNLYMDFAAGITHTQDVFSRRNYTISFNRSSKATDAEEIGYAMEEGLFTLEEFIVAKEDAWERAKKEFKHININGLDLGIEYMFGENPVNGGNADGIKISIQFEDGILVMPVFDFMFDNKFLEKAEIHPLILGSKSNFQKLFEVPETIQTLSHIHESIVTGLSLQNFKGDTAWISHLFRVINNLGDLYDLDEDEDEETLINFFQNAIRKSIAGYAHYYSLQNEGHSDILELALAIKKDSSDVASFLKLIQSIKETL